MLKLVIGSLLAALALFFFGFIYWALSPMGHAAMKPTGNDAAVQAALRSVLTESGSYVVPGNEGTQEEMTALHEAGPLAVIHYKAEGGPVMPPSAFVRGLLHSFTCALLLGFFMKLGLRSLPTYRCRLGFSVLLGATCALFWDAGAHIWWMHSGAWSASAALYDVLAFTVLGSVMAALVKPAAAAD